jgi:alternate signal-mediated exported protein
MNEADSQRSRRRLGGIVALAAGVTLLVGGGTYSLWNDAATFTVTDQITAGDLDINTVGDPTFWDVSADRAGDQTTPLPGTADSDTILGHSITSLADYRVVPKDTLAGVFQYNIRLEGDNLVAKLDLTGTTTTNTGFAALTYEYQLFDKAGKQLTERLALNITGTIAHVQAPGGTEQAAGGDDYIDDTLVPVVDLPADGDEVNLTLVLFANFTEVNGQVHAQSSGTVGEAALGNIKVNLTQVRDASSPSPRP